MPRPTDEERAALAEKKRKALLAMRLGGSKALAAEAAQTSVEMVTNWRKSDDDFARDWDVAVQSYIERLRTWTPEQRINPPHYSHDEMKERILEWIAEGKSVGFCCHILKVSRGWVKELRTNDPIFDAGYLDAIEHGKDVLEDEALRRAVKGVQKPVFYMGEIVGHITEYSDSLLKMLMSGRRPELWNRLNLTSGMSDDGVLEVRWREPGESPSAAANKPVQVQGYSKHGGPHPSVIAAQQGDIE